MVHFCPNCFREIASQVDICPFCHYHIADWGNFNFDEKLSRALEHPDSFTRRRAAFLLGERKTASAFDALLETFQSASDPYFKAEILQALFKIDRRKTLTQLTREQINKESVIVQKIFENATSEKTNGSTYH